MNIVEQINGDLISKQLVLHKFTTKTEKKTNNIKKFSKSKVRVKLIEFIIMKTRVYFRERFWKKSWEL